MAVLKLLKKHSTIEAILTEDGTEVAREMCSNTATNRGVLGHKSFTDTVDMNDPQVVAHLNELFVLTRSLG